MTPRFYQRGKGCYRVTIDIKVNTLSQNVVETAFIGTVRKINRDSWEPETPEGKKLPYMGTRKAATTYLILAYQKDPPTVAKFQDHPTVQMISRCRGIARRLGLRKAGSCHLYVGTKDVLPETPNLDEYVYEDKIIQIIAGAEHGALEITRQPMPDQGMPTDNPCIMVNAWGVCYRSHGESCYLEEHVERVAQPDRDIGKEILDGVTEMVSYEKGRLRK